MLRKAVALSVPVDIGLLPIVTGFVEQSGNTFGLPQRECLALTLAAEEVFAFIAGAGAAENEVQIICRNGGYYMEMAFQLRIGLLPLEAFNLTRKPVMADDLEGAEQLGLILASRAVDRLAIEQSGKDTMVLRFVTDKRYPTAEPVILPDPGGRFEAREGDVATLQELAARILAGYGGAAASFLTIPGKLTDMAASRDYEALVAVNQDGQVGGGIVYGKNGPMAEGYGPFVFGEEARARGLVSRMLVEKMLEKLGRAGDLLCLAIMAPTPQTPPEYFEPLPGGAVYRQLAEDTGARVYAHPCLKMFLKDFYAQMALPRMIQEVAYMGEELARHSAVATAIDRQNQSAALTLLWAGQNLEDNLRAHVKLLQTQGIETIDFWMRLGSAVEAMMAPQITAAGFEPVMALPWARQGDAVVFRHRGRAGVTG